MKAQFIATRKIIENDHLIEIKGYQVGLTDAHFMIHQLQKIYSREDGWYVPHFVKNQRGKALIDFEMEAERDDEETGVKTVVMFSMAKLQEVHRRYR